MLTILLVASEAREFAGLRRHCRRSSALKWGIEFARSAEMKGRRLVMVANGAGPALAGKAADAAGAWETVEALVSTGTCGALDPVLRAGEIFVASSVVAPDEGVSYEAQAPECPLPCATGRLVSVDRVVRSVEEKKKLHAAGAAVVEMEASAVAARAKSWGVPFYCVRAVTDRADEELLLDYNAARNGDGRLSTTRILAAALRRPWMLAPELFRLQRRSRQAAQAVGEFIAHCRF